MDKITHEMRREKWISIIRECNESGMKKRDWLAQHKISPKSFYAWQRKLRMEIGTELVLAQNNALTVTQNQNEFCQLTPPATDSQTVCAVIRTDRFSVEVNESITDEFLLRILRVASHV